MPVTPLGEAMAYVRLRVNSAQVEADTAKGIEQGVAGSKVAGAAKAGGRKSGKGFAGEFSSALNAGLPGVARQGEKAGESWGTRFGASAGKVTSKLAKFGLIGIGAAAIGSIKLATDFQTAMKKIQTQAGASSRDVKILSADILAMRDVQQSPIELANSLYHLKSVGLDNVQAMKALRAASDLAAVGGARLEDTTNAIAGAWRSGITGARNFRQAASTVNAIIGAGNMRMADFISAIGTGILPAAKTFGLSLKNVGAALALMTDEGIPANVAATRLRMSFSLLGAPSKAAEKQLNAIGLTGLQLANTMRGPQGIIGAIGLLKDHLDKSGLSASKQAILLSHAFGGGRSSSAILTLINNYDVLKRKQDQINDSLGKFPSAVEQQRKTTGAQLHLLGADFERIGVQIGTKLLPPVTEFVGWLAKGNHLIPILTGVMVLLTAAIIVQAVAWAATPIGMVSIAITALIIGITLLIKHWKTVSEWWRSHPLLTTVITVIMGPIGFLIAAIGAIATHWIAMKNTFSEVVVEILHLVSVFLGSLLDVVKVAGRLPGPLGAPFRAMVGPLQTAKAKVDALGQAMANLHSRQVSVTLTAVGGGKVTVSSSVKNAAGFLEFHAAGGLIGGVGGPTSDANLIAASRGEYVHKATAVSRYGVAAMDAINSGRAVVGFAGGGLIGSINAADAGAQAKQSAFGVDREGAFGRAMLVALKAGLAQASFGAAGPGGGAPAANAALARRLFPGENFPAWNYVAMRESGWSQFALNANSGAYGIAQALPPTKYPFAGQAAGGSNPRAQITWMEGYMQSRYGGATGAAAHERAFNWYDNPGGSWMPPGISLSYNGTGAWERLTPDSGLAGLESRLDRLIAATHQTGPAVGQALTGTVRRAANSAAWRTTP